MMQDENKIYNSDFPEILKQIYPLKERYINDYPFFEKIFKLYNPHSVLDIGCGSGFDINLYSKILHNCKLVGIDNSELEILKAKKTISPTNSNQINYIHGDALHINKFIKEKFDLITFNFSLSSMGSHSEILRILEAIKGKLNKNGILIISDTNGDRLVKHQPRPEIFNLKAQSYHLINNSLICLDITNNRDKLFHLKFDHKLNKTLINVFFPYLYYKLQSRNYCLRTYQVFPDTVITNYTVIQTDGLLNLKIKTYRTYCSLLTKDTLSDMLYKAKFNKLTFFSDYKFSKYKTYSFSQIVIAK